MQQSMTISFVSFCIHSNQMETYRTRGLPLIYTTNCVLTHVNNSQLINKTNKCTGIGLCRFAEHRGEKNIQSCHDDPSLVKVYFLLVLFGHLS